MEVKIGWVGGLLLVLLLLPTLPPAQAESRESFRIIETRDKFQIATGETLNWLYLKQSHYLERDGEQTLVDIEYVAIDKQRRGEIGFTDNGVYIGRIVPVVTGKRNGVWYLIPITNATTVTDYGFTTGSDENGNFTKVYYSGAGTFPAYRYGIWTSPFTAQMKINEISVKLYHDTGKAKLVTNVTSTQYSLDDSGAGFLFIPRDPAKFRYAKYVDGNEVTQTIDLLNIDTITDPALILHYWSENAETGVSWDWEDLYSQGTNALFEVLQVAGIKGILTGSYGYGPRTTSQPIVVDPTLTLSPIVANYGVVNTWYEGGAMVGYNCTLKTTDMGITTVYNYWENAFWTNTTEANNQISSTVEVTHLGVTEYPATYILNNAVAVIENSDTRLIVNQTATGSDVDMSQWTCYTFTAGKPLIGVKEHFYNTTNHITALTTTKTLITNMNGDIDALDTVDILDNFYATKIANKGAMAIIYPGDTFDLTHTSTLSSDSEYLRDHHDSIPVTSGWYKEFYYTIVFGPDTIDPATWVAELDNELADSYAAVTGTMTGATYDDRNHGTLAYDFTHTTGHNVTFTFNPTGLDECNFTTFNVANWNIATYHFELDDVELTEDTDYYAYYNATTGDLCITTNSTVADGNNVFSIVNDPIKILTLSQSNNNPGSDTGVTYTATAELEYSHHALGAGDSFTLSGVPFTWSAALSQFIGTKTATGPLTFYMDSLDSGSEATFSITSGGLAGLSVITVWQALGESGPGGGGGGGGGGGDFTDLLPPSIEEVVVRLEPWWAKYGTGVIILSVIVVFVLYSGKPEKNSKGSGLDVVFNPEKILE